MLAESSGLGAQGRALRQRRAHRFLPSVQSPQPRAKPSFFSSLRSVDETRFTWLLMADRMCRWREMALELLKKLNGYGETIYPAITVGP